MARFGRSFPIPRRLPKPIISSGGVTSISVTDSGSSSATVAISYPKMETLQEDFMFGGVDVGKWSKWGTPSILATTNLLLEMTTVLGGAYGGLLSLSSFDLTGSYAFSQLVDAGNQSLTSLEVYPVELSNGSNALSIMISGNIVYARKKVSGTSSTVGSTVSYNSSTMKWFRVRESGGTTYWEYATDPTSTWTQIASASNPITVTSLIGGITIGTWQAESSTTTAKVSNFNVIPGSLQFTWKGYTWNKRIHIGDYSTNKPMSVSNVSGPDGSDYLTLKITNPSRSAPAGAEIFSDQRGFGYGIYTVVVDASLAGIDPKTIFGGLFLFDFTSPPDYREIDVNEVRNYNGNTNIQILHSHVYNNSGVRAFITDNVDVDSSSVQTHRLIWEPSKLTFDSFIGTGTGGTNYFHSVQTTNLPTPGLERVHFNIWIDNVSGWESATPLSVILRDFTFSKLVTDTASGNDSIGGILVFVGSLNEAGSGSDSQSTQNLSSNISISDSATGSDSQSILASLAQSDSGSGSDSQSSAVTISGSDSGSGVDALTTLFATLLLNETSSGAELLSIFNTIAAIADSGSGSNILNLLAQIIASDNGSASDNQSTVASITGTDSGSGNDALSALFAQVNIGEVGSTTDVITAFITIAISDLSSVSETIVAGSNVTLTDNGSVSDTLSTLLANITLNDSGNFIDALSIAAQLVLSDLGSASESPTIASSLALTDNGIGSQIITVASFITILDSGSAVDVLSILANIILTDSGTVIDTLSYFILILIADNASGNDTAAASFSVLLSDFAQATEIIYAGYAFGLYLRGARLYSSKGKLYNRKSFPYYNRK